MNETEQFLNDVIATLQRENAQLKATIAGLEARLLAPWVPTIRDELSKPEYDHAVAAQDAAECLRLLRVPGEPVLLDPIPVEHVRAVLSAISPAAAMGGDAAWLKIVDQQAALLAGVTEVPRARVVALQKAAVASGVLESTYQIGAVELSTLARLGCADVVTRAEHIALAMGWGLALAENSKRAI